MHKPTLYPADVTDPPPLLSINTTPLIDVMLVLLIMLILTIPLGTHTTKLDMPTGGPAPRRERVSIDIDFDGSVYWNDAPVRDAAQLDNYLHTIAAQDTQPDLVVTANKRAAYDAVAQVLAAAQRNGVRRIGFGGNERFSD